MDAAATAAIGAGCAAVASLATGVLLRVYDQRKEARTAGLIDVMRKRHIDRYDALRALAGTAAELFHQVLELVEGEQHRQAEVDQLTDDLRRAARQEVQVVGKEIVQAAVRYTDTIRKVGRGEALSRDDVITAHAQWNEALARVQRQPVV